MRTPYRALEKILKKQKNLIPIQHTIPDICTSTRQCFSGSNPFLLGLTASTRPRVASALGSRRSSADRCLPGPLEGPTSSSEREVALGGRLRAAQRVLGQGGRTRKHLLHEMTGRLPPPSRLETLLFV